MENIGEPDGPAGFDAAVSEIQDDLPKPVDVEVKRVSPSVPEA